MEYSETRGRAGEYLRLALSHMARLKLPANPINYTLFYEYVSGRNLRLKKAIDLSLARSKALGSDQAERLYSKFVTDGDRLVINRLLTKINLMLKDISHHLMETEGDLAGHGDTLGKLAVQINDVKDFEGTREIVDQMIIETKAILQSGTRLQSRMKISSQDLHQLNQELNAAHKEAQTDALTGLINRRGLEKALELERIRVRQNQRLFSVILLDLDHFKRVNDTYGHLVGDSLLKGIAQILQKYLRQNDVAARFGGEEFLIVLPETELNGARAVAEKIKRHLNSKEWKLKDSGKSMGIVTASMGIAVYQREDTDETLINRADSALYIAKKTGRNRVITQETSLAN